MKHLLSELGPDWHFHYNPSMNYFDPQRFASNGREEEGAAVLSKYPIVDTDFVLLPRFFDDSEDNQHQRQCIRARVDVPNGWGLVDVFTTHLSLSERARDASVQEMWRYVVASSEQQEQEEEAQEQQQQQQQKQQRPTFQVLMGDLNAEPDTAAIQFLQGLHEVEGISTDFQDAWLAVGMPEPESHSTDEKVRRDMLTFPSHEPKKRIDLILFRQGSGEINRGAVEVVDTKLYGQDPSEETKDDAGHGMLDQDSPMWASDHRGVASSFVLKQ
jgi:endonuclease/exonuclease/phosphatase family metal-dependent hydrolase